MPPKTIVSQRGLDGWAMCLQSAYQAGLSQAALRQAIMIHHARQQTEWEMAHDWDPWEEWVYCLRLTGLPPDEIARARQAYFALFLNGNGANPVSQSKENGPTLYHDLTQNNHGAPDN